MSQRIPVVKKGEEYAPFYAIVDDEDYPVLSRFTWTVLWNEPSNTPYARASLGKASLLMHQMVLGGSNNLVDHANGLGLDNRKENLREASFSLNQANTIKRKSMNGRPTSSQYKGVCERPGRNNPWTAQVRKDRKQYYIGAFATEEEAARAYDAKALELFGEFARLNFP